jgi:predicted permease
VELTSTYRTRPSTLASIPRFVLWREERRIFSHVAAYQVEDPGVNLTEGDRPEPVQAIHVSARYFAVLGVRIAVGRAFDDEEDRPNGPRVAVISHGLWQRRFAADPAVVGRAILLGHEAHQVVGVMGPGFAADPRADIWLALHADPRSTDHATAVRVIARLAPGVSLESARRQIAGTTGTFRRLFPLVLAPYEELTARSLHEALVGEVRPALNLLASAVLCVLLISCANVANLLLARGHRRRHEIATRTALGAGRLRLVRQLLTESLLLALAGGAVGLWLGHAAVRALLAASPGNLPRLARDGADLTLDPQVLVFALLVSLGTAVLFGLVPALHATRVDLRAAFIEAGISTGAFGRHRRVQSALVVGELMLALVLLVASGLLLRTVNAMRTIERGFDARNVLALDMSVAEPRFDRAEALTLLVRNAGLRLQEVGGVSGMAVTRSLPTDAGATLPFTIDRRALLYAGAAHGVARWVSVSPSYFAVLRIRRVQGRMFGPAMSPGRCRS